MPKKISFAVVGATGAVGETILEILANSNLSIECVYALASDSSYGSWVLYDNKQITLEKLSDFDFSKVDIAFFSAGSEISLQYAPKAVEQGCYVIDNTAAFRLDSDVPLLVPEINGELLQACSKPCIIANPNCVATQLVLPLKPFHEHPGISSVNLATYQAVSGIGKAGVTELANQTTTLLNGVSDSKPQVFKQAIAFNAIPLVDELSDTGYSMEELKIIYETQKIFNDPNLVVNPTAVRLPFFYGHGIVVNLDLKAELNLDEARQLLEATSGVELGTDELPPTPRDIVGTDSVHVSRLRVSLGSKSNISFWVVADNLRKGAALNSVQIAENLSNHYS